MRNDISISEAARTLGKSNEFVRLALQQKSVTWGFAVKMSSGQYSYHISPKKFYDYIGKEKEDEDN